VRRDRAGNCDMNGACPRPRRGPERGLSPGREGGLSPVMPGGDEIGACPRVWGNRGQAPIAPIPKTREHSAHKASLGGFVDPVEPD